MKLKPPLRVRDVHALDLEFYSLYDENHIMRKVDILAALMNQNSVINSTGATYDLPLVKSTIGAEIHFSEIQLAEAFIAMLSAPFQGLPHAALTCPRLLYQS